MSSGGSKTFFCSHCRCTVTMSPPPSCSCCYPRCPLCRCNTCYLQEYQNPNPNTTSEDTTKNNTTNPSSTSKATKKNKNSDPKTTDKDDDKPKPKGAAKGNADNSTAATSSGNGRPYEIALNTGRPYEIALNDHITLTYVGSYSMPSGD